MSIKFPLLAFAIVFLISTTLAQRSVDVGDVLLEKDTLFTVCPMGDFDPHRYCNKDSVGLKLKAIAKDTIEGDEFYYTPSAGQIVGTGNNVLWDLSNTAPGTYSVTVGIGSGGVIRGKVVTKTVKLVDCPACDPPCECPSLGLAGPSGKVLPGDMFIVRLVSSGGDTRDRRTYRWTARGGTIVQGEEGTSVIVRAPQESAGKNIEMTIDLQGFHRQCNCEPQRKISVSVSKE